MLGKVAETTDDSKCQERSKSAKNQGVTSTQADGITGSGQAVKVPNDDSRNTIEVTRSDKTDNGLYIGTGKAMEPGSFFSGLIDDVRIYNRAVRP